MAEMEACFADCFSMTDPNEILVCMATAEPCALNIQNEMCGNASEQVCEQHYEDECGIVPEE